MCEVEANKNGHIISVSEGAYQARLHPTLHQQITPICRPHIMRGRNFLGVVHFDGCVGATVYIGMELIERKVCRRYALLDNCSLLDFTAPLTKQMLCAV